MPLPAALNRHCKTNWAHSLDCKHLCWLSIALCRRGIQIPADRVAQFFYEGEVIGVVWCTKDDEEEQVPILEVFHSASNLSFVRFPLVLTALPFATLCKFAWAEEYHHVVAIFKTPIEDMSFGRLLLALFNLSTKLFVCHIEIGESDDPDFPTSDLAVSGPPWKIVCAADGALMLFAVTANQLSLIWRSENVWTEHLIFTHNNRLAYIPDIRRDVSGSESSGAQVVSASTDAGQELSRVRFSARFGKVQALTCMSKSSSVVLVFQQGRWPLNTIQCYRLDLFAGQTSDGAVLFAVANLGSTGIMSLSCTEKYLLIGTYYGHIHIASDASHRVFSVQRGAEIDMYHKEASPPILLDAKPDRIYGYDAHGVMRWS